MDPLTLTAVKEVGLPLWKSWLARRSKRILVVEDYEPHAELMRYLIERLNFKVDIAQSSDVALALIGVHRYRAAFVDVNIPGAMNGIALAEIMHRRQPAMKITIASADEDVLAKFGHGKRFSFIKKDVTLEAIEDAIFNGK